MMTFFEWYSTQPLNASANPLTFALQVWEAATLAERERCLNLVEAMYDRNTSLNWNDALEEVSLALRDSV